MNKHIFTLETFIEAVFPVHGESYYYCDFIEADKSTKIEIFCKKHNIKFSQRMGDHLRGHGCKLCGSQKAQSEVRITMDKFLIKAKSVHGDKYNYSLVEISDTSSTKSMIKVICSNHSIFEVRIGNHYNMGCPDCAIEARAKAKTSNTTEFIEKSKKVHGNKFDYSKTIYVKWNVPVEIICPKLHLFTQTPLDHLHGHGCNMCSHTVSKPEIAWLDSLNILKEHRQKSIRINGVLFKVDAFDPDANTIYEFNGDYYHGNPEIYNLEDINPTCKKSYKELYEKTLQKEATLKAAGYNIISIWENDWNKQSK